MQCKACNTTLTADAKFCHECGEKVAVDISCNSCNTVNLPEAKFCKNCGTALDDAPEQKSKTVKATKSLTSRQAGLLGGTALVALVTVIIYYYIGFQQTVEGKTEWRNPQQTAQDVAHDHDNDGKPDHDASAHQGPSQADIDAAQKHVDHDPEDTNANTNLANLLFDAGQYEEAIPYYQKSLTLSPDNPDVIVDLGVCFFNLKDYEQAKSQFQLALNKSPEHINALYNSGVVAVQLGEVQELIQYWSKLREIAPDSPQALRAQQILEQIHEQVTNQTDGES